MIWFYCYSFVHSFGNTDWILSSKQFVSQSGMQEVAQLGKGMAFLYWYIETA